MAIDRSRRLPAETDFIQLLSAHPRELQASLNSKLREARVVLLPADPLLRYREEQFPIPHNAR